MPRQLEIFADIDPWSVIADIEIDKAGVRSIVLRPTECAADGLPVLLEAGSTAQAILARVAELSAAAGTAVSLEATTAAIRFD